MGYKGEQRGATPGRTVQWRRRR